VIGGLVPAKLTDSHESVVPPHLGTTDVDTHLSIRFATNVDSYDVLETALRAAGCEPDARTDGWRWFAVADRYRVNVEFLCDVESVRADTTLRSAGATLGVANVRGTRYAEKDWVSEQVEARLINVDEVVKVQVRFVALHGYLMTKAHAILSRGKEKDYYDFAYVLLYNRLGGPGAAGTALRHGKFAEDVAKAKRLWDEISARYFTTASIGPASYAAQSIVADPSGDDARLRQDAVGAVQEFIEALRS
jgi:hypothetical protein